MGFTDKQKRIFEFINGWPFFITVSIFYAFVLGGITYLILGTNSGIIVGIIAFLYGLKKGPEIKRQQDRDKKQLDLMLGLENPITIESEFSIDNLATENNQKTEDVGARTIKINNKEKSIADNLRIPLNEANYLLDGYNPIEVREGSMAKVFICETDNFKDEVYVAVKVLKGFSPFDFKKIKNWLYECHSWIMLGQHPNIVQIKLVHSGVHSPQIVMEYVENTLEDIKNNIKGDILKIINIGINICDALIHASNKISNFVHLDLKPQNILISSDYQAKITDFGIIHSEKKTSQLEKLEYRTPNFPLEKIKQKKVHSKDIRGTIFYMSPEQIKGNDEIDCRSDMYSLGCIFYELITGKKLFTASNIEEYLNCHLEKPPPLIENDDNRIPPELLKLMYKCLVKRKEARFLSFIDIKKELVEMKNNYFNEQTSPVLKYPPNEEAIITVVEALIKLGDYENSRLYLKSITKKIFIKNYLLGLCDSKEEKYIEALPKFKSCLKYASTKFEKFILFKELGYVIEKSGDLKEALRYFNLCVDLNPELGVSFADIARVNIKLGRDNEVIRNYKHSLDLAYDPRILARYVQFLNDNKKFEDAILELQKALLMFVDDMQLHIYLAQAAIGKLVEDISNNKNIPEIERYLLIARKHAEIACKNGFQINKAKDILDLYNQINNKISQPLKRTHTLESPKTVTTVKLNKIALDSLNNGIEEFLFLTKEKKLKELTELIYPPMFYGMMELTSMGIEQIRAETVKFLISEMESEEKNGISIKDINLIKNGNDFFKCNSKIYTSFLFSTTALINGKTMKKKSKVIAISEDGGNSWYFSDSNELAYKFLNTELPQNIIDVL